jgi:hypothetical protein
MLIEEISLLHLFIGAIFFRCCRLIFNINRIFIAVTLVMYDALGLSVNRVKEASLGDGNIASSLLDKTVVFLHVLIGKERVAREQKVDLFEGPTCDFGIEKPYNGKSN